MATENERLTEIAAYWENIYRNYYASDAPEPPDTLHDAICHVDELLDVIREQQAQIAAMRPIVEAMAQPNHQDSACYVLCNREVVALSGSGVFVTPHSKPCLIEQARAFVAAHPATVTAGEAESEGE